MLLATAACNFWSAELQKVVRGRQFFFILCCEFASRHSGVQFVLSAVIGSTSSSNSSSSSSSRRSTSRSSNGGSSRRRGSR